MSEKIITVTLKITGAPAGERGQFSIRFGNTPAIEYPYPDSKETFRELCWLIVGMENNEELLGDVDWTKGCEIDFKFKRPTEWIRWDV